jgi:large subunit ribosomal protein L21
MFAIVETGGKQYKVTPGLALNVERLTEEPGATVELDRVLMIGDEGGDVKVGNPFIGGAKVTAHVLEHGRAKKIIVFKYKAKSNYRRRTGHRQELTRLRITDILPA